MSININLLPWREELKEQRKREFLFYIGFGASLTVGIMLAVHLFISKQISFQHDLNNMLKSEITVLDQKINEIKGLQKEKEQLLARMEIIQQLQTNRPHVVRLFDVIVRTVPEGLYLTSLTRTGTRILVDGKAESNTRVSSFMRNIDSSAWLNSPILSLIQADDKEPNENYIGFNLQAVQNMGNSTIAGLNDTADGELKNKPSN